MTTFTDEEIENIIRVGSTEVTRTEQRTQGDPRYREEYRLADGSYLQVAYDEAMGNYRIQGYATSEQETDEWLINEYGYRCEN